MHFKDKKKNFYVYVRSKYVQKKIKFKKQCHSYKLTKFTNRAILHTSVDRMGSQRIENDTWCS